ncbi:MAG: hypothetical protein K8I30_10670, partial [Anaerolineae bacterium]|nr:hypothetical protein [Anaerolineae bacterium]
MSIALDKIRDVMITLDEGAQAGLTLDSLLKQVLPSMVACLPGAQAVRVYRFTGQTGKLEGTTDSAAPSQKHLTDAERGALQSGDPVHDQERWVVPLLHDTWVFGWLEVDAPDVPDMRAFLSLLAYSLTRTIRQVESSGLTADNLVLSSRLITTADNYSDMVQAVVYTVGRGMVGVALTLFDQPLDDSRRPHSRMVAALGTAEGSVEAADTRYQRDLPDDEQFKSLLRGSPIIVQDFRQSGFALSARQMTSHKVKWLAAFGLRAGDHVLGTLELMHSDAYQLLPEEIDAYTTLADQIGVAARNRQLLQQTSDALDEVKTLYEINRAMLGAQDQLDVLRALYSLTPDAASLSHVKIIYDEQGELDDLIVQHLLTADQEQVIQLSMRDNAGEAEFAGVRASWHGGPRTSVFVEDIQHPPEEAPILLLSMGNLSGGNRSVVGLTIYERDHLTDLIRVGFSQPRTFNDSTRR